VAAGWRTTCRRWCANIAQLEPEVQRKIVEHGLTENTTMYAACGP